jgi:uncharacterized protein
MIIARRRSPLLCLVLLSICAWLTGCQEVKQSGLPTVPVQIGSEMFTLEVANTPVSRERGLMNRESMPADHGMLFVFPDEEERAFWMKNTTIPLDILYLSTDAKIVSVKQMRPLDETSVRSDGAAKYAIELNQGTANRLGIKPGDSIDIPDHARRTTR